MTARHLAVPVYYTVYPIQPREVYDAIQTIKPNKSGGPSGVSPGVLRILPANWIIFIAHLFTAVFRCSYIPSSWGLSRLIVLFKKGGRTDCNNYRGISVMDTFAKLYDLILCRRLELWMKPAREQAGAQKGRGCTEHIISLRMLFDYATSRRKKLFVTFVDFSKAYDKVPRRALIQSLITFGCGASMTMAIAALYGDARMVLGSAIIATSIGLRQGSPTSCWLFTAYINKLVKMMRECPNDGFLGWLHCLLLMDDTIIVATTRERLREKVSVLLRFCQESGMVINQKKTNLMVINGTTEDRAPLVFPCLSIESCEEYTYLGAIFTEDGKMSTSVEKHIKAKKANVMKFVAFLSKNRDFPFTVKKQVLESALISSIFYGCEAWVNNSARRVEVTYRTLIKTLLGVRTTTANDLCLAEIGYSNAEARVKESQRKFLKKILLQRKGMTDDPFMHVWSICKDAKTKAYIYYDEEVIHEKYTDHVLADITTRVEKLRMSTACKSVLYLNLNPLLETHDMYRSPDVHEHERIVTTQLRLSSHNLAVEKGRWSRIPFELCVCECGQVQTVDHVLRVCPKVADIREKFPNIDFSSSHAFWYSRNVTSVCEFAYLANKISEKV